MRHGYTLVEVLAVLVITAVAAAIATASISWPHGGSTTPADEYRRLLLHSQQQSLIDASRVTLELGTDGTFLLESTSRPTEALETGRIASCSSQLRLMRPARFVFDPTGLIVGDTVYIVCDGNEAIVHVDAIAGSISVEF